MAIRTTNSKPKPLPRNYKCANCGQSFRSKRKTKKFCSDQCQKAAKRAATKIRNPQHQILHRRLEERGFIGQVWPVYRVDNSPKIFGLLVPKDFAAAELGTTETDLSDALRSFGIVDFKSNVVEWKIWDFYKALKHQRNQHTGDRFRATPPAKEPKGSRPSEVRSSWPQASPSNSFSIPVDLVGGSSRPWPGATRIDPNLRQKILDTEIGGVKKSDSEAAK